MELTHVIQIIVGVFTAGAAWGAARMGIHHVESSLKQHMADTSAWRDETGERLLAIEQELYRSIRRR